MYHNYDELEDFGGWTWKNWALLSALAVGVYAGYKLLSNPEIKQKVSEGVRKGVDLVKEKASAMRGGDLGGQSRGSAVGQGAGVGMDEPSYGGAPI
jgi:hypothetical protein